MILLRKEFRQFFRNKFLPKIAFAFPCVVMLIIPLVATMDVRHVGVAVVDNDHSALSRRVTASIADSPYFTMLPEGSYGEGMEAVESGRADVIVTIPRGFERSVQSGGSGGIKMPHIASNGVNGMKGSLGSAYVAQSIARTLQLKTSETGVSGEVPMPVVSYLFNPTLEYRNYMIPALMTMLIIMLCGFLPALNLIGEKESGTIEQINVSPVGSATFVLSKLVPYWIVGIIVLTLAMALGAIVYGLYPAGNVGAIYLASLLFVFVMSGVGVTIANYSSTMTQGMFVMLFVVLVFVLMSGLMTPVSSMPDCAEAATYVIPPRYFIEIMRSVYLKGSTVADLTADYFALVGFAILSMCVAAVTYRKQN